MIYVRVVDGTLVPCAEEDAGAHVLFSVAESRDVVLRRDLVTQDVVDATAEAHEAKAEPAILRQLAAVILGRARSPLESQE